MELSCHPKSLTAGCPTKVQSWSHRCTVFHFISWLSLWSLCTIWPSSKAAAGVVALQHHLVLAAATGLCSAASFHALRMLLDKQLGLLVRISARLLCSCSAQ
jgi:hypothetical protein